MSQSFFLALLWRDVECAVLSASTEQSRATFGYALAFLQASPVLAAEIVEATRGEIRLRNGIVIAIHTNSFRTVRGRTLCAAIFDEVAYWRDDTTAVPDVETYTAVLPSLATTNGMLIGISSPHRRTGLLHAKHKAHFGVDGDDVLCVHLSQSSYRSRPRSRRRSLGSRTVCWSRWTSLPLSSLGGRRTTLPSSGIVYRTMLNPCPSL